MRRSIRHSQHIRAARPRGALRRALTMFALVAFALQGYLIQTHIHGLSAFAVAASGQHTVSASSPKAPTDGDDLSCPLCQDSVRAGNYLVPAAVSALPPTLAVNAILFNAAALVASKAISHIWQSRGPPLA